MGGINPPATSPTVLASMQEFTRALCLSNQNFWQAHAQIESAVLEKEKSSEAAFASATRYCAEAACAVSAAISKASNALQLLETEHHEEEKLELYLHNQLRALTILERCLGRLHEVMTSNGDTAWSSRSLQQELLFDGKLSAVRVLSLEAITTFGKVNASHGQVVEDTNRVALAAA